MRYCWVACYDVPINVCSIRCDIIITVRGFSCNTLRFSLGVKIEQYTRKQKFEPTCSTVWKPDKNGQVTAWISVDFSHLLKVYYLLQCKIYPRHFYGKIAKNCVQLAEHCRKVRWTQLKCLHFWFIAVPLLWKYQ